MSTLCGIPFLRRVFRFTTTSDDQQRLMFVLATVETVPHEIGPESKNSRMAFKKPGWDSRSPARENQVPLVLYGTPVDFSYSGVGRFSNVLGKRRAGRCEQKPARTRHRYNASRASLRDRGRHRVSGAGTTTPSNCSTWKNWPVARGNPVAVVQILPNGRRPKAGWCPRAYRG